MKQNKNKNKKVISRKKQFKRYSITTFFLSLAIILFLNIISSFVFYRADLTSEKRYSLSDATKTMLRDLDDLVFFRVYLEGDFPAGFRRLRNATKEMLDEFRAYSSHIQYEFINPTRQEDPAETRKIYELLMEKGLEPTQVYLTEGSGSSTQVIFPGAIVSYQGQELPVQLLNSQMGASSHAVINNSIQAIEYNFAHAIKMLTQRRRQRVAFLEGHGQLSPIETADIFEELSKYYTVRRVSLSYDDPHFQRFVTDNIDSRFVTTDSLEALNIQFEEDMISEYVKLQFDWINSFDALVIAQPMSPFNEKDKFIIDQYIMNGGKVLWFIDAVHASMDSLIMNTSTMGFTNRLNIEDQLFKYGVRINNNLIQDLKSSEIPLETGRVGNQPQYSFFPWPFFPIIMPESNHPIVNNLNAIKMEFVSSIDTIAVPNVDKTILLTSSRYSRTLNVPVPIDLNILRRRPDERLFNRPHQPVAVLLEGSFESLYKNRLLPSSFLEAAKDIDIKENSQPNRMIVVSDGNVIRNQLRRSDTGEIIPLPLGYDRWTRQTFGNKDFVMNCINYLLDDSELIYARAKEFHLRLLDSTKVRQNKSMIQAVNFVLPIFLIIVIALILYYIRKRKYALKKNK